MVEGQFVLKGVTQETMKFYQVLGSLLEMAVNCLGDLMHGPPPEDAYIQLKAQLLAAHTFTKFQRMEKLLTAQALGGQKLSDMLHDLVQFCPDNEAQTRIFRYLSLQQLPTEIRIILAEDRDSKLAALAARADQLWAHSSRGRLNAIVPGSLAHIVDQSSGRRFLIDTGASFSIMPYKSALKPQGQRLAVPEGQSIPCWGECKTDLIFNGRHFAWTFLLADVQFPIIGVDFLGHFRLLVDIAAGRLVDTASSQSFPIILESSAAAQISHRRSRSFCGGSRRS